MENSTGVIRRTFDDLIYFESEPMLLSDIYFGSTSTSQIPSENTIIETFTQYSGNVGGPYPIPRQYNVPALDMYYYWVVRDSSGDGSKVINAVQSDSGYPIILYAGLMGISYTSQKFSGFISQSNPHTTSVPPEYAQTIYYKPIKLRGQSYRLYRTAYKEVITYKYNVFSVN